MSGITNYTTWYQQGLGVLIPWLFGGPNGQLDGASMGTVLDQQTSLLKAGIQARFPDFAPTDALPHIGGDRGLVQGGAETNNSFVTRLKDAWAEWSRAGQWRGLLEQLWYDGLADPGTYIVQPNGLAYSFSGAPTPGQDPTSLLTITNLLTTATPIASSVQQPTTTQAGRSVPAGTAWFPLDGNTDLCSRFVVIYAGAAPWAVCYARAVFTASETASVTWPRIFPDTTYNILLSPPTVTDGGPPPLVSVDDTLKTVTGVGVRASASFTGYCDMIVYPAGANPFASPDPSTVSLLQTLITRWRPNALCSGVYLLQSGRTWDWPPATWATAQSTWAAGTVARILGVF